MRPVAAAVVATAVLLGGAACSSNGDGASDDTISDIGAVSPASGESGIADTIYPALEAVEEALGEPQQYFEVTANARFTNVFVAVDDATAAVAYLYVDGELAPPGPKQEGASGKTFTLADVEFDPDLVLDGVAADLENSSIDALSVYGTGIGAVYVVGVTSESGGFLDIEVGPTGQVFSVDPV